MILQELAVMKQVLISMLSKQGHSPNPLGAEKTGIGKSSAGQLRTKSVVQTTEVESPNQPKPTVFVSVRYGNPASAREVEANRK